MSRLGWKSGRFTTDYEVNEIHTSLRSWQSEFGQNVLYYRYWGEEGEIHDIWDEASGVGRVWHPPMEVGVLQITHAEGRNQERAQGQYFNDDLYATASFEQLRRLGLTDMDLQTHSYARDRIIYDYRVFRVTRIQVMGQIQQRDVIVSIEGTEVKPDEMLNDRGFEAFANRKFPRP